MAQVIGRNEPCPCGSGKKYKNCCSNKGVPGRSWNRALPGILILAGLVVTGSYFLDIDSAEETADPVATNQSPVVRTPDLSKVVPGEKVTVLENERFRVTARPPDSLTGSDTAAAAKLFEKDKTVALPPKQTLK